MADPPTGAPAESVHSPAMSAHISHAVIATYAAAAARGVPAVEIPDGHPVRPGPARVWTARRAGSASSPTGGRLRSSCT
jgi:hypothetical protein